MCHWMHVLGELAEQTSVALIPQKEEEKKKKKTSEALYREAN